MSTDDPILQAKLDELTSRLAAQEETNWTEGQSGSSVNWTEYDVNPEAYGIYMQAKYVQGDWMFPYSNYETINKPINKFAAELEDTVNLYGWKVLHVGQNGHGFMCALLHRVSIQRLPKPKKIIHPEQSQPTLFDASGEPVSSIGAIEGADADNGGVIET